MSREAAVDLQAHESIDDPESDLSQGGHPEGSIMVMTVTVVCPQTGAKDVSEVQAEIGSSKELAQAIASACDRLGIKGDIDITCGFRSA